MENNNAPQSAGDIRIDEIMLIDRTGNEVDVQAMLVELNLFEDIFSSFLYGNILLSDGQNLIAKLPIIGDEYIRIKVRTPSFEDPDELYKTFRVYSVSDRSVTQDDRMQQYIVHFCSMEAIADALQPLSKTFSGRVDKVVTEIFEDYIQMPRNIWGSTKSSSAVDSEEKSELIIFDETKNSIKFTSPQWTPAKCLSWLASKSISKNSKGANFLFFETNKQFVFASIEQIIDAQISQNLVAEHYIHSPNNIRGQTRDSNFVYKRQNLAKEYRIVESFHIENNFNTFDNLQKGYYASKLYKFDVITKDYKVYDFDYVEQFNDYKHMETIEGRNGGPFFMKTTIRNPDAKIMFYPSHPGLYNDTKDNASEIIEDILQNRISLLNDLSNYKIHATVPGRTDIEVGNVVRFDFPNIGPKDAMTMEDEAIDKYHGGLYLITAIRHKINYKKHMMTLELIKDSVQTSLETI